MVFDPIHMGKNNHLDYTSIQLLRVIHILLGACHNGFPIGIRLNGIVSVRFFFGIILIVNWYKIWQVKGGNISQSMEHFLGLGTHQGSFLISKMVQLMS